MAWMNELQLGKKYADPKFQKAFAELFTLHYFLAEGLVSQEYKPPDVFGDAIALTPTGKSSVPGIQAAVKDISLPEINLALFLVFFHHELFVDVKATNHETIRKALDAGILGARIKYPWVYGKLLYDRFFDMFLSQTEELSYEETRMILENTPQGVFQIRDVVVGPFGVLNSYCHRFLEPVRDAPLWHCSDPSCQALHPVRLSTGKTKVSKAADFVSAESEKTYGPPSEWHKFFLDFAGWSKYYDDMNLTQFPWLLVNAFSEREIRIMLKTLIDRESKKIRQRFPKSKRFENILSGSGEKIAKGLTKAQCFQLILLMSDETIADSLEFLIKEGAINIPNTETRIPKFAYRPGGWLRIRWECSRFGIRSVSTRVEIAFARLKRLIKDLYKGKQELALLKWRLRHVSGESIYEKLDRYLHTEDPKCVIKDLVFDTSDHLHRAFKILRYGWFALPASDEEEKRLIEKILWKLGFDIGLYPPHQSLFWERLEKFLDTIGACTTYDEEDKELIRSGGVNFFVSLEEILDYSLSFMTWALLSDHYGITKFKCNFEKARQFMASRLNGLQLGSNEPLKFDEKGRNTLYPLIQGFAVLAEICSKVIENERDQIRGPANELPGFHGKTEIELFPFLHRALVLDIRKGDCDRLIGILKEVYNSLEKAQICSIRNRIEHRSLEFPSREEIEKATSAVRDIVKKIEETGISPLIYLYERRTVDQYRRTIVTFKDYRGREIKLSGPSQYRVCGLPSIRVPQIIVPCMHINDSFELLRFQFEEVSDYVEMWEDYPKRRLRIPSEEVKEETDTK